MWAPSLATCVRPGYGRVDLLRGAFASGIGGSAIVKEYLFILARHPGTHQAVQGSDR